MTALLTQASARVRWDDLAACRGMDQEIFFPPLRTGPVRADPYAQARLICGRCPVRLECLGEAMRVERGLEYQMRAGMFGGHTPEGRAGLDGRARRRRGRGLR